MDYKDLKNGEVVKIIDYSIGEESTTIAIVNKVEQDEKGKYKIYTYADLDMDDDHIFVEKECPSCSYSANNYAFEPATEPIWYLTRLPSLNLLVLTTLMLATMSYI